MNRTFGILLMVAGAAVMLLGYLVLPKDAGRLSNAIEIADPRPLSSSAMPDGLRAMGALSVTVVEPATHAAGPARLLLVPHLSGLLSSADAELGKLPPGETAKAAARGRPKVAAGAATGLRLGPAAFGSVQVEVAAILHPLGPLFDSYLLAEDSSAWRSTLRAPSAVASRRYLLLAGSWGQRGQLVARLAADPSLLPGRNADIISPARPPALSDPTRWALACVLGAAGAVILAVQLRGFSRAELSRRLGRT